MNKTLKVRGLIRIKPEMPKANKNSVGHQKCPESLSFEARKVVYISFHYFYLCSSARVIRSLPENIKTEST